MTAMTPITVAALDGAARPLTIRADQGADNSIAFRTSLEIGGAPVGAAAPVPVQMTALTPVYSQALEAAHVLKAAQGTLLAIQANYLTSGYILLLDANAVPPDGPVVPVKAWRVDASLGGTLDKTFAPPLAMQNGAVLVFSTADSPLAKAGSAQAIFSGEMI